ncbi:2-polyprenyl-6-methoxyphenol hydroxylase-like oxidoreductase [Actinobacteria bacterium IMCC26207]|nr:2-polyprenyl-6-methoxyphenol hydroxylase-like oxidoreductase [Actinobacteria bacterium IMCC26207]
MAKIAVLGAGIAGLGVALGAARAGHDVVLIERDDTPLAVSPAEAFDWDRQGAPQVRHSHAFLARLRNLLRDRYPDVLADLYAAGATPMDFISMLPEGMDRTPLPGDEDLVAIACRRTTFEWVLRRTILNESSVKLVHGMGVTGLQTNPASDRTAVAQVTGLTLEDGTVVQADITVIAGGRRHDLPGLLSASGVAIRETIEDTGIVYYSRFFQLREGAEFPAQTGPIGGDLGYLKFGVFPGDNRTFSITLAAGVADRQLRRQLTDPDQFITIAAQIPATAAHVEVDRSQPITGVNVMAGLLNRRRGFLDESGEPVVLGLHAVGDAHTCTNPLYGRGCSLALVQAELFADSLKEHGLNHRDRAVAFEGATRKEITPWYRASVAQDRLNADSPTAANGTADAANGTADAATSTAGAREFMRDGLLPAMRTDPVVVRAFLRMFNLLEDPNSLMTNSDVVARVLTVFNDREDRPVEASMGPDRVSLLGAIS